MSQSQTISNYLNGNYLLSAQQENQLILLQYQSEHYQKCYRFLNYQIFNHLTIKKPLIIIDLDGEFHQKELQIANIYKDLKIIKKNDEIIVYDQNIHVFQILPKLQQITSLIEENKYQSTEILIRGYELQSKEVNQLVKELLKQQYLDLGDKFVQQAENISQCIIIIDSLRYLLQIINIHVTMIIKKPNGHSFIKQYEIDGKMLLKNKLSIQKIKKVQEQTQDDPLLEMQKKVNPSFNISTNKDQQQIKSQLDNQINPYKQAMGQQNLQIYQKEGDEKKMLVDIDDEDFEEVEEYEG